MLEIYFNIFIIADSFLEESRIFIFNEEQAGWKRPNLWTSLKQSWSVYKINCRALYIIQALVMQQQCSSSLPSELP